MNYHHILSLVSYSQCVNISCYSLQWLPRRHGQNALKVHSWHRVTSPKNTNLLRIISNLLKIFPKESLLFLIEKLVSKCQDDIIKTGTTVEILLRSVSEHNGIIASFPNVLKFLVDILIQLKRYFVNLIQTSVL